VNERDERIEPEAVESVEALSPAADDLRHEADAVVVDAREVRDEEAAEGAEPFFPPTDPVLNGRGRSVIGGFDRTSMDSLEVDPSTIDEEPGDEALAEAVRRELREDALTSALAVDVQVRRGIVFLRGTAGDIDETDDVAEVASRVPGVREVVEQMAIREG